MADIRFVAPEMSNNVQIEGVDYKVGIDRTIKVPEVHAKHLDGLGWMRTALDDVPEFFSDPFRRRKKIGPSAIADEGTQPTEISDAKPGAQLKSGSADTLNQTDAAGAAGNAPSKDGAPALKQEKFGDENQNEKK